MTEPLAALDRILTRTRHLLLDFDGPMCDFYPGQTGRPVADQLRQYLRDQQVPLPGGIAHTDSPIEIFTYAATISPALAASIEAELTALEITASASAAPNGCVPDLLVACRESARTVTVVSNASANAIHAYLAQHALSSLVTHVAGRASPDPGLLKPSPHLIEQALSALNADPSICTMAGDSPSDVQSASQARVASIGYASNPSKYEQLSTAGADVIITSLADLVPHLRAGGTSNP